MTEFDALLCEVICLVCGDAVGRASSLSAAELLMRHAVSKRGVDGHDPSAPCYLREGQDFVMLAVGGADAPAETARDGIW